MATEGIQLHDGAQCVAGANLYNPTSALPGPNGSGQFCAVVLSASADRTVLMNSTANGAIYGILQNTPLQGDAADVCLAGITKAVAGAAITRGAQLGSDNQGRLVTWASGPVLGYAIESAGAAGNLFTAFITP